MDAQNEASHTPKVAGKQMSKGLRERLKKCGRSYASPVPNKRQCQTGVSSQKEVSLTPTKVENERNEDVENCTECHKKNTDKGPMSTSAFQPPVKLVDSFLNTDSKKTNNKECVRPVSKSASLTEHSSNKLNYDENSTDKNALPVNKQNGDSRMDKSKHSQSSSANFLSNEGGVKQNDFFSPNASVSTDKVPSDSVTGNQLCGTPTVESLRQERTGLIQTVSDKEETLRKLNMVKMYRSKNDLHHLQGLIDKWRSVSQEAVQELHQLAPEPRPSMNALVSHLQMDPALLHYNIEDESFY